MSLIEVPADPSAADAGPRHGGIPRQRSGGSRAQRRKQVRRRRRRRLAAGGLVLALLIVLVCTVGSVGRSRWRGHGSTSATSAAALVPQSGALLISIRDGSRVPVSVLLRADAASHSASLLLLPAGLQVAVGRLGIMPLGDAVTSSDPTASAVAVGSLLGLHVDATWTLTPEGVAALVDAVGGVRANIDRDITADDGSPSNPVVVPAGAIHVNGRQAAYVTTWLGAGEPERQRLTRVVPVLSSLFAALGARPDLATVLRDLPGSTMTASAPTSVPRLVATATTAGAAHRASFDVVPTRVGAAAGSYVVDRNSASRLLGTEVDPDAVASPLRVLVQGPSARVGRIAGQSLVALGMTYLTGDTESLATSQVLLPDDSAESWHHGAMVATALHLPPSVISVGDRSQDIVDLVVVLGSDYHASAA